MKQLVGILDKNLDDIVEHFQTDKCFVELGGGYMNVIR